MAGREKYAALADVRLAGEYEQRKRSLIWLATNRYRMSPEDAEEVADDTLLAWYRKLCRTGFLASDRRFCERVLQFEAIDRIRAARPPVVELSTVADQLGADPQLDTLAADREQARRLCMLARRLLTERQLMIVWLLAMGHERQQIAGRVGLRELQVKRSLARARGKLREARQLDRVIAA